MKKIIKIVIIGCMLLGLSFFILIKNTKGTTPTVILKNDVSAGQIVAENMLEIKDMPKGSITGNVIKNKNDVLGKTLSIPRVKGDYIPKDIIKKVNIELRDNEVAFSLKISKDDVKLIQEGGEIALSLISGNNTEPLLVKGIYVMAINNDKENQEGNLNEEPSNLIIAKTTEEIGNKIAPYMKNKNYKVLILPQDKLTIIPSK